MMSGHDGEGPPPPSEPANKGRRGFNMQQQLGTVDARLGTHAPMIDLLLRVIQLVLSVIVLICLGARGYGNLFVFYNAVLAVVTALVIQFLEALNVPQNNSTPEQWTFALFFTNIFWSVNYLISGAFACNDATNYNGTLFSALKQSAAAAAFFCWLAFLVYLAAAAIYAIRWLPNRTGRNARVAAPAQQYNYT